MPTVAPIQNNFTGGEFSPLVHARSDVDRYKTGARKMENFIPSIQGSLLRRPATQFVAEVKDSSKKVRLIKFQFSTTQSYILEMGEYYIRFFKDHGQVQTAPNVPYEIPSPYTEDEIFDVKFAQSVDVMYLTHPNYPLNRLSRYGDTNWVLTTSVLNSIPVLQDGPYLATGKMKYAPSDKAKKAFTTVAMTPSATTGAITLTASVAPAPTITGAVNNGSGGIRVTYAGVSDAFESGDQIWLAGIGGTVEANGAWRVSVISPTQLDLQGSTFVNAYTAGGTLRPLFFTLDDVDSVVRVKGGATWGYVRIVGYTSGVQVNAQVIDTLSGVAATHLNFRYGLYYQGNYPSCVTFHEDRLCLSGSRDYPQRVDLSNTGDYENFAPSAPDGTIGASNAFGLTINSSDVNAARWLATDEKGLLVGTDSSEWVIKPASTTAALSATNFSVKRASNFGSANIDAVLAGKSALYLQKSSRRIRELIYFYDVDGFRANDLSILSEHLLATGIKQMAYQKEPHSLLWCVRNDGALAVMTYDRDADSVKAAWSKQVLGGFYDAAKTIPAKAESVAVISAPSGLSEEAWIIANRYIDGENVKYVEYVTKFFEDEDAQEDALFLDCSLTYDGAPNDVISGLDHLEGETVQIVADGAVQTDKLVTGGTITLDAEASVVHIGYHYNSDLQLMRFDAGSANGTAIGKVRRTHLMGIMLHRSLNMKFGMSFTNMLTLTFRADPDLTNAPTPLFTGIKSEEIEADSDMDNFISIRQDQPFPLTILAIMPQMKTQDNI